MWTEMSHKPQNKSKVPPLTPKAWQTLLLGPAWWFSQPKNICKQAPGWSMPKPSNKWREVGRNGIATSFFQRPLYPVTLQTSYISVNYQSCMINAKTINLGSSYIDASSDMAIQHVLVRRVSENKPILQTVLKRNQELLMDTICSENCDIVMFNHSESKTSR